MAKLVTPFLWLGKNASEAAKFYTTVFKKSKIIDSNPMSVTFELDGQRVIALNGGDYYKLTPAFSFYINCKNQKEIDNYWTKLSSGGKIMQCGWVTDKFGLTWQVIPDGLSDLIGGSDPAKSGRAMKAMLKMKKLDIAKLKKAYQGK